MPVRRDAVLGAHQQGVHADARCSRPSRPPLLPAFAGSDGAARAFSPLPPSLSLCDDAAHRVPSSCAAEKYEWLRAHCVHAAFTVHHDVARYEAATGVPFYRTSFGVDAARFAAPSLAVSPSPPMPAPSGGGDNLTRHVLGGRERAERPTEQGGGRDADGYRYDLGFTGVVRSDQTGNWRYHIWKRSWPRLRALGVRLFSGDSGGVRIGKAHAELSPAEYVRQMRSCKVWLSTTGPADLVGTRFFEVMATGTTLLIANRNGVGAAYSSLGLVEGRHALFFSSLEEFEALVLNVTRPSFEPRRRQIVARAQELVLRRFTWSLVASRIERVLDCAIAARRGASGCAEESAADRHRYRVVA